MRPFFSQIYNRFMALGYPSEFILAQYFENELMEFDQILHNQ